MTLSRINSVKPVDITNRYQHIRPLPQLPNFAAHIDIDLNQPLSADVQRELYQALLDFEVLFFPPQEITPDQHVALARVFGDLATGAFFPRKAGEPQLEVIEFDEHRPPEINIWHSDLSWLPNPPTGSVIQITELPDQGGNTSWASLSAAFAALSPGLQHYLGQLTASHTWEVSGWRDAIAKAGDDALASAIKAYKPVSHPVVRTHPESGKQVLYVSENFTKHIEHVNFRESRGLLQFLREWIVQPEFVYTHKWQRNGIAVWDNRTTQHHASADYWPQRRVTQRVTFNARGEGDARLTPHEQVAAKAYA